MAFRRGFTWGLLLGAAGVVAVRAASDESNRPQWEQAKHAGNLAAALTESKLREKLAEARKATPEEPSENGS